MRRLLLIAVVPVVLLLGWVAMMLAPSTIGPAAEGVLPGARYSMQHPAGE
jgi:hypothetical protein